MTTTTTGKPERSKPDPKELGRRGEAFAVGWLSARGYTVVARNWRCSLGEVDVVAHHEGDLVAVEVKTRSGVGYGAPAEAVTGEKLARLHRLALSFARETSQGEPPTTRRRVDVLSLIWPPGDPVPCSVDLYRAVTP
ncbi:MAG: YraN family protein [Galactobacter sp.]|uniref:YraN family protein n=1 Tax=Galactobacter sp. TaxID=2676125 RepID=UPI0025BDA539|nr:YraN family protein [Galactobacter sp.]